MAVNSKVAVNNRMGLFPGCRGLLSVHQIPKDEGAAIGGSDDIDGAIMVQVDRREVRSHPRTVVNQLRYKLGAAGRLRIAHGSIPVQNRGTVWIGIGVALQVRERSLPGNDVRDAVAVQIREGHRVQLREGYAA